jgi:hypothetical protein
VAPTAQQSNVVAGNVASSQDAGARPSQLATESQQEPHALDVFKAQKPGKAKVDDDEISSCTVGLCGPLHGGYQDNILD